MPEAPRSRPSRFAVLHTFRGHVRARPAAVFAALDARFRPSGASDSLYLADPAAFLLVAQGGWWYRGEYRVVPDEHGSHVEHVILNVATTGRSLGRFTARRVLADAPAAFDTLIRQLRLELE
ncbi:MAG: hypothetical protein V4531_08795 [Actinomycetota bacterium]